MNNSLVNSFYQTIGREIKSQNLSPRCYVLAIQACGSYDYGRLLQAYTQLRLEELKNQWMRKGSMVRPSFLPAETRSSTCANTLEKKQLLLWIYLKAMILLGIVGGIAAFTGSSSFGMPSLNVFTWTTSAVLFAILAPDTLAWSIGLKYKNFFQWNWYAALLAGIFSFYSSIKYLNYYYYQ